MKIEGTTEVLMREFDVKIELGGVQYEAWGNYIHGEGFEDTIEIEEAGNGPCVEYDSPLYDAILKEIQDWITGPDVGGSAF